MPKPIVYNLLNQGKGIYSVETSDHTPKKYGNIFIGEDDWMFETAIYSWTQTNDLGGESVPIPNGSLIRVDDPDILVYVFTAWPVIVGGSDMSEPKGRWENLHFFTEM